jgi:hypothetical protein
MLLESKNIFPATLKSGLDIQKRMGKSGSLGSRVARWYIFRPKIAI